MLAAPAQAGPFLEPGDLQLRNDIQLLADSRVIQAPVTTWPMPWNEIGRGIANPTDLDDQPAYIKRAYFRVRARLDKEGKTGKQRRHFRLGAASYPDDLPTMRTFADQPREELEVEVGSEWTGDRFAYRLQVAWVDDPVTEENIRFDHSYAGFVAGGWSFSIDALDRWWGPGYEGALILSQNARPVPGLTIQRNSAKPFESKWLNWLGPWNFVLFNGVMEKDRGDFDNPYLFGMRLAFKPFSSGFELGLGRTAMWCGDGQPCGWDAFWDMFGGRDPSPTGKDGFNQLSTIDFRWASPAFSAPFALYGQWTAEDQLASGEPSRGIYLGGLELWGGLAQDWSWRAHLEYSDTLVRDSDGPRPNVAYNHSEYTDGYRYYGRVMGHSMDNDGRMRSLGLSLVEPGGTIWNLVVRDADLNRDGGGLNSVTLTAKDFRDTEISNSRMLGGGKLDAGLAYQEYEEVGTGEHTSDPRLFVQWKRQF